MKRSFWEFLILGIVIGLSAGLMLQPLVATAGDVKVAAWLEVMQRVCTSIGGVGTFLALGFVMRQFFLLRTQTDLVQRNISASLDAQRYARLDSYNRFIVEHCTEYALLEQSFDGHAALDDRPKLHHLCELGFTFFEETYKHHIRYKLLNGEDWDEWQQNMLHFFSKPYVRGYWNTVAARYARSFQAFANDLVVSISGK